MVPNEVLHILTIHFESPKSGQPLFKGQDVWSVPMVSFIWRFHCSIIVINDHNFMTNFNFFMLNCC